jgi:uncharacterized delta-60 repeat protein
MVVRYSTDGSVDASFGTVTTMVNALSSFAAALVSQPDGKIVTAGAIVSGVPVVPIPSDFLLVRYNANGSPDESFGSGGFVVTDIDASYDYAVAIALQPDGKLVVAGVTDNGSHPDFALVRYNPDGTLDYTFGRGGKVITDVGSGSYDYASGLLPEPDGKLVVAGQSYDGTTHAFALVRYNPRGGLDATFGRGGKVTTTIGGSAAAFSLVRQPDGKLVAAGSARAGDSTADFALVRYNANGTLDAALVPGAR